MTRSKKTKKPLKLNKRSVRKLDEQHLKKAAGGMTLSCDGECAAQTDACATGACTEGCETGDCGHIDTNTRFTVKASAYC
jgi:hypothetical protein